MKKPDLKVLRNIADKIWAGNYGEINTVVVATFGDVGLDTFGGGRDSDLFHCSYLFGVAHTRMLNLPLGGE